jgi:putative ABC transport system permease protein
MLKNFTILAIRNLLKNRATSIINILGFSLGITSCLIIYFKVTYELSFDRFHSNAENTFRVVRVTRGLGLKLAEGEWEYREGVFGAMPGAIKAEIPEARLVSAVMNFRETVVKVPENKAVKGFELYKLKEGGAFVEPAFFKIFDFKGTPFRWIEGTPELALKEPNSIVLAQSEANRYFHGQNPVGKTITLFNDAEFRITGLVTDLPANSDFPFKVFISYTTMENFWKGLREDWGGLGNNQCFVMLDDASQKEMVEGKIKKIYAQHATREEVENRLFKLQPLKEIHSDSRFENFSNRVVSKEVLWALLCVGLFIIIIAGINYAILALARSGLRTREVGIRKVFGSSRAYIVGQFLGESFVITLLALNIGLLCTRLILSFSPKFIGIPATYPLSFHGYALAFSILLLIVVSMISGSFPALIISGVQPMDILKRRFLVSQTGKLNFTRTMVVLQFTISLIMIISTMVVFKQLAFLRNIDPGYNKEAVFTVEIPKGDPNLMDRFKTTLLKDPRISNVSLGSNDPAQSHNWTDVTRYANDTEKRIVTQIVGIDTAYLDTYQLNLLAGKNITSADSGRTILVNQQFVKDLDFKDIYEAIDQQVNLYGNPKNKVTISGVLKDYYCESLRIKVRPALLIENKGAVELAGIKISIRKNNTREDNDAIKQVLQFTRETWESVYPDYLYEYTFLEDRLNAYYRNEQLTSQLFNVFSIIAIFIGCLGIFGLAYFTCEQKSKEIAVRKVNGASIRSILMLLSRDYAIWLGIAFVIACPVAYYAMHAWLKGFAYKTAISWWVYVLAGTMSLCVAAITVSWQSYKAARKNPVEAMKYE